MKSNISETILKVVQKVTLAQGVNYQIARAVESRGYSGERPEHQELKPEAKRLEALRASDNANMAAC